MAPAAPASCDDENSDAEEERELEKLLETVTSVRLFESADDDPAGEPRVVSVQRRPVHRYGDAERRLFDSTLWMWGAPEQGRPTAAMKFERYPEMSFFGRPTHLYGLVSLSPRHIRVEIPGTSPWTSSRVGVDLKDLPGAPVPSESDRTRTIQARALARRFTAHLLENPGARPSEMRLNLRLLPRPLYEYSQPDEGLLYGALFGLANGTNPDVILVIEAQATDAGPRWKHDIARLTRSKILVQLDGNDYFDAPETNIPTRQDTYLIHIESADAGR